MRLAEHRYATLGRAQGPLLFVHQVLQSRMGEMVQVQFADGRVQEGEVLRIEGDTVLLQLFGDSAGLSLETAEVVFSDRIKHMPLDETMLGRIYNGSFAPLDDQPMFVPSAWRPVSGAPLNPARRARPEEFIETGISTIDGLNTLVKGQKLPIFSAAGLPSKELAAAVLRHARTRASTAEHQGFAVVFVALGLSFHEYTYYLRTLQQMRTDFLAIINLADDPVVERLLAPRFGLTAAEYLAFDLGRDVLVVITDMTNYCDALREISTAREELPGRRGYPGYMYSDLASLYERAGRIQQQVGSVTLLPVLTMPEDDITHPIPDLTGYITEGQIVLSRELDQQGLFPPVDVLPSLSRLMQQGIGADRTSAEHRPLANLLYRYYAKGRDLRNLEAIVGREGMAESDRTLLDFAQAFETEFVHQGEERRDIFATLAAGVRLLERFELETP